MKKIFVAIVILCVSMSTFAYGFWTDYNVITAITTETDDNGNTYCRLSIGTDWYGFQINNSYTQFMADKLYAAKYANKAICVHYSATEIWNYLSFGDSYGTAIKKMNAFQQQ